MIVRDVAQVLVGARWRLVGARGVGQGARLC